MATTTENTAHVSATSQTDSSSLLKNELLYNSAFSAAKSMLKKGLVSRKEYTKIDTILRQKFKPRLSLFLSENT